MPATFEDEEVARLEGYLAYVVMRRFSAKEEHRRIVAALLFEGELPGSMIGLGKRIISTTSTGRQAS